jgi:glucokinase
MITDSLILALDFGGTKLAAGLINGDSRHWIEKKSRLSPVNGNASSDIEIMYQMGRSLLKGKKPAAIGISFGGPVDMKTGMVRLSHHVQGWENMPLKKMLEDEFEAMAIVDNDANVAALGEYQYGAGVGSDSLFYITVSTGVGGGWILNGKPWGGHEGMAGEIGHIVIDPAGPICLCGKKGCVERFASGSYMAEDAKEILKVAREGNGGRKGEILRSLVGNNLELVTGQLLSQAADMGDKLSQEILHRSAWALGIGIGNVANVVNPKKFILGGGVIKAGERWWNVVRKTARETALPEVNFEIVAASLGDDAPLWGAVAMARMSL